MKIVMIPSVSGGLGHISRTATLARAIHRLDPEATIEYVLDTERLRQFNVEAVRGMGYQPRLMPNRPREHRAAVAAAFLGDADVIVDDTTRYLIPLRADAPRPGWVSIPMHPLGDELFMDWPLLKQADAVIWAYAAIMPLLPELEMVRDRLHQTGPFLDFGAMPEREAARRSLGLGPGDRTLVYAPRGFPFGKEFGHRALGVAFLAARAVRARHPGLRLHLLAVANRDDLGAVPVLPEHLPDWVQVHGMLPYDEVLLRVRAADILLAEGSSSMHEGAALGAPQVLIPGPIDETLNLAKALGAQGAARTILPHAITPAALEDAFRAVLDDPAGTRAMADRARALVSEGGGVAAAAEVVLEVGRAARARASAS